MLFAYLALLSSLFLFSCGDSSPRAPGPTAVGQFDSGLFIRDVTGKQWNVTHARNSYGMQPNQFQYGLGPQAISPILTPHMLLPGEPGYPDDSEKFLVIGVELNGFTRAYPLQIMGWHEVADERFGEAHVAVAY